MRVQLLKFWSQNLTNRVANSFLFLSLVTLGVVGGVAFWHARDALKQAAFDRLSVAATLKEEQINLWFEDQERDFLLITQFPDVQRNLKIILSAEPSDSSYQAAYIVLSNYLKSAAGLKPNLQEVFVLDRSSRVILSTDKRHEGKYEVPASVTYLEQVEPGDTFAPIFYVSRLTGKPAVTLATPFRNEAGVRQGVVLAHLSLEHIDQIVRQRTGFGKSGETYLVGSLVSENTFISRGENRNQEFSGGISSQGIDSAMQGASGYGLYRNYAGVPVIGVYHWLNDQDIALLVEMSQNEAFAPARQLAGRIVLVGLISVAGLTIGVSWLARQLQISRQQLENYSHQLEQKAQEANAANRAKSEFLANMSHELRTPLNAILGFAQLMERDSALTGRQRASLTTINRSGEHLLNLINDVLEMSKIEAGRVTSNPVSFDLHRLLQTIQEMFQIRAAAKQLSLQFEIAPNLPQSVFSDEGKLRQVLINLLSNAVKFTQKGGVTLRARAQMRGRGYTLYFEIEDTGRGVAPEEIDTLFQPFVQTTSGMEAREGTGLGLTISRQFVRLMGGNIQIASTVDQGSTFCFDVQVTLVDSSDVPLTSTRRRVLQLAPNQPEYRILVVDDRPENRDLIAELLTLVGFETRVAENGQAAIEQWQAWHPNLIWMDMRMPVMDGYQATRYIRTVEMQASPLYQRTIIIALTASAFEEQQANIIAVGCDDFVRKPFREQVIFEKMADYLGVQYIYAQEEESNEKDRHLTATSHCFVTSYTQSSSLQIMPEEWIANLHQAALAVDGDRILQLIEQIPEPHRTLAAELAELVHRFCFDEILELTQKGEMSSRTARELGKAFSCSRAV